MLLKKFQFFFFSNSIIYFILKKIIFTTQNIYLFLLQLNSGIHVFLNFKFCYLYNGKNFKKFKIFLFYIGLKFGSFICTKQKQFLPSITLPKR